LELSFHATCRRWEETYGEPYAILGGMYRGEPETAYYNYATWSPTRSSTAETVPLPKIIALTPMGASSTGSDSSWVVPSERDKSYIRAHARSRTRGANANPQVGNYVFGKGSKGDGYYSFATKDAYQIIKSRLTEKYQYEYNSYHGYDCRNCLCLGNSPSADQMRVRAAELLAIIKARLTTPGPDAKITLSATRNHGAKGNDQDVASSWGKAASRAMYYDATPACRWMWRRKYSVVCRRWMWRWAACGATACGGGGGGMDLSGHTNGFLGNIIEGLLQRFFGQQIRRAFMERM
jgi:hypothetical protein